MEENKDDIKRRILCTILCDIMPLHGVSLARNPELDNTTFGSKFGMSIFYRLNVYDVYWWGELVGTVFNEMPIGTSIAFSDYTFCIETPKAHSFSKLIIENGANKIYKLCRNFEPQNFNIPKQLLVPHLSEKFGLNIRIIKTTWGIMRYE